MPPKAFIIIVYMKQRYTPESKVIIYHLMNDTLTISIKAGIESVVAAEKELKIFQNSINSVNTSLKQT